MTFISLHFIYKYIYIYKTCYTRLVDFNCIIQNQAKQTVKQICVGVYLLIKKNGLANLIKYKEMRITKVFEPWLFENHTIAIVI